MTDISLIDAASYMPANVVDPAFFNPNAEAVAHDMFRGPRLRHHVGADETVVGMIEKATARLVDRIGIDPARDIDIILTNAPFHDNLFTGSGASLSRVLGCNPMWIYDLANTGCVSFVFMLSLARALMATSKARSALICNVQHTGGRIFAHPETRKRPQAAIPGDGCGVAYLVASGENPVRSIVTRSNGEYADDMRCRSDDGKKWWEAREAPLYVDFNPERIVAVVQRGNTLVPEIIREACTEAEISPDEIDLLITNQPNRTFLRNWREALGVPEERHLNTFEEHGNLFGAAMPICLEAALHSDRLEPGSHIAIGGFSHAGDYAGAAIVEWNGR